jgi:hypothetical protein
MHAAEKRWRYAPTNLNLAGYHRKNVTGRGSAAVLRNPVRQPLDYSALKGLGNILFFEGEVEAAQFFVEIAVECAAEDGVDYQAANKVWNRSGAGRLRTSMARSLESNQPASALWQNLPFLHCGP